MSSWSVFYAPITVGTGGWALRYSTATSTANATIPAATYDTYLHMMSTLSTAIQDNEGAGNSNVSVNTLTGKTSIRIAALTSVDYDNSNASLLSTLGLDQTETVTTSTLTANNVHYYAWYPGLLSMPSSGGVGKEDDSGNEPQETSVQTFSGSGKGRGVGPARDKYTRTVRFGAIKTEEYDDKNRGPINLKDRWKNSVLWWYFDREVPAVRSYSTQVDPGYSNWERDDDGAYIKVFVQNVQWQRSTQTPRWRNVSVTMNVEPK
ncbi:MAG: hypothetical protein ACYTBJ_02355 [Planctomycetota bacterium]|jgi:hypothetical protein